MLSPYTVTIYTKQDNPYNVIPEAPIEIRERLTNGTSGSLSIIYSDQEGLNPITQTGAKANSNGQFTFYAAAASYNAIYESQTVPVDTGITASTLAGFIPAAIINNLSLSYVFTNVSSMLSSGSSQILGKNYSTGGTIWTPNTVPATTIAHFDALTPVHVEDFGLDQASMITALNYARSQVRPQLFWGDFLFTSTANLDGIHDVSHSGPGRIQRGSDIFYPQLLDENENHIYVANNGASANDGLTAALPIDFFSVRPTFRNYAPYIGGKWFFEFAAGTYDSLPSGTSMRIGPDNYSETSINLNTNQFSTPNFVVFRGPDVGWNGSTNPYPLPTAIFDSEDKASVIFELRGIKAYVRDIKFSNANGSASSAGLSVSNRAELYCENVHTDNCTFAISASEFSSYQVRGGIIDGSGFGSGGTSSDRDNTAFRSLFHVRHSIGNQQAGSPGEGPLIRNCSQGLFAQEGGTGHSDFATYENNTVAIRSRINSRVNMNGSEFKRNGTCGIADTGSNLGWNGNEVLNIGTADANDTIFTQSLGGNILYVGPDTDGYESYPVDTRVIDLDSTRTTITGTTTETYYSFLTFPEGYLNVSRSGIQLGKILRVTISGVINNNTGNELAFRARLGEFGGNLPSTTSLQFLSGDTNSGLFTLVMEIYITDSDSDICDSHTHITNRTGSQRSASSGFVGSSAALSTAGRKQLRLSVVAGDNADSVTINNIKTEIGGQ